MAEPATTTSNTPLTLGSEFPTPTRDQWLALVEKVLAGAPFDRKLVTNTYDGLRIEPLYVRGDGPAPDSAGTPGAAPFTRAARPSGTAVDGWDVRQFHSGADRAAVNTAILTDLAGGATSVLLGPVPAATVEELDAVLDGVHLDIAGVQLAWGANYRAGVDLLTGLWARRGIPASAALGCFGVDPLGALAREGRLPLDVDAALAEAGAIAADTVARFGAAGGSVQALSVDASVYGDAGATDVDELAAALATGVAYLRAMTGAGLDIDAALGQLTFTLTATADQFSTIAKLRAARRCWGQVAQSCGASLTDGQAAMTLHAVTARAMFSQRDPWVNILRTTLATFAAGVGGADAITTFPLGSAAGVIDELGLRLARNTQIVLQSESGLARVIDPAGGSWYVESLTDDLAQAAWAAFQRIEAAGGMAGALASGQITTAIEATWAGRLANLARRRDGITGVSEFPNLHEAPLGAAAPGYAFPAPAGGAAMTPLPLRRHAQPFEELRDRADGAPTRPAIFSANLGPIATHTARASYAKNLFEVGGIAVVASDGFDDEATLVSAFQASGASAAVLCSSDAVYAERAVAAAQALKAAGCTRLYLAGNPGERKADYEAAGVDEFVFIGCDTLAVLDGALEALVGSSPRKV